MVLPWILQNLSEEKWKELCSGIADIFEGIVFEIRSDYDEKKSCEEIYKESVAIIKESDEMNIKVLTGRGAWGFIKLIERMEIREKAIAAYDLAFTLQQMNKGCLRRIKKNIDYIRQADPEIVFKLIECRGKEVDDYCLKLWEDKEVTGSTLLAEDIADEIEKIKIAKARDEEEIKELDAIIEDLRKIDAEYLQVVMELDAKGVHEKLEKMRENRQKDEMIAMYTRVKANQPVYEAEQAKRRKILQDEKDMHSAWLEIQVEKKLEEERRLAEEADKLDVEARNKAMELELKLECVKEKMGEHRELERVIGEEITPLDELAKCLDETMKLKDEIEIRLGRGREIDREIYDVRLNWNEKYEERKIDKFGKETIFVNNFRRVNEKLDKIFSELLTLDPTTKAIIVDEEDVYEDSTSDDMDVMLSQCICYECVNMGEKKCSEHCGSIDVDRSEIVYAADDGHKELEKSVPEWISTYIEKLWNELNNGKDALERNELSRVEIHTHFMNVLNQILGVGEDLAYNVLDEDHGNIPMKRFISGILYDRIMRVFKEAAVRGWDIVIQNLVNYQHRDKYNRWELRGGRLGPVERAVKKLELENDDPHRKLEVIGVG